MARGTQGYRYAWGQDLDAASGNTRETELQRTIAVGLFPEDRAFKTHDMSGNIWEWTTSRWGKSIKKPDFDYTNWNRDTQSRDDLEPEELRIIRGGSWLNEFGLRALCVSRRVSSLLSVQLFGFSRGVLPGFLNSEFLLSDTRR